MTIAAIIVAAGKGLRLGGEIPKQYRSLGGHMVLTHTLQAFVDCAKIDRMVCVISPEMQVHYQQAIEGLHSSHLLPWVPGGADRVPFPRRLLAGPGTGPLRQCPADELKHLVRDRHEPGPGRPHVSGCPHRIGGMFAVQIRAADRSLPFSKKLLGK